MYYIVGLGNPGTEYENTRHNVGWMVLDCLRQTLGLPAPVHSRKYAGRISQGVIFNQDVTLLYPDTFMNQSGGAVKKLVPRGEEKNLIVIYDDVDIPLGNIKISFGRGDGGHNGIKSIIASLGTKEFARVRVGIAPKSFFGKTKRPKGHRLPAYVLGAFKKREQTEREEALDTAQKATMTIIQQGIQHAMKEYNEV